MSKPLKESQKAIMITDIIIIASLISTTSLALNSLMQDIFNNLKVKTDNKILLNFLWVILLGGLTVGVSLLVFRKRQINPIYFV